MEHKKSFFFKEKLKMERRNPHLKSPLDDLSVMAMTGLAKTKELS